AIDDRRTRRRLASCPLAGPFPQVRMHPFPGPIATKLAKIVIHRAPRTVLAGQVTPGTASADQIKQSIDDASQVKTSVSTARPSRRKRSRHNRPFGLGQVTWVHWKCHT